MKSNDNKRFYLRAFIFGITFVIFIVMMSTIGLMGTPMYSDKDLITKISHLVLVVFQYPFIVLTRYFDLDVYQPIIFGMSIIFYSLIIERVYYLYRKKKKNRSKEHLGD